MNVFGFNNRAVINQKSRHFGSVILSSEVKSRESRRIRSIHFRSRSDQKKRGFQLVINGSIQQKSSTGYVPLFNIPAIEELGLQTKQITSE